MPIEEPESGLIAQNDIIFLEAIALAEDIVPITRPGDPDVDQFQAFLKESFVFIIQGIKGDGEKEERVNLTIAMPEEAVMFMIEKAMERLHGRGELDMNAGPTVGLHLPPGFNPRVN